MSDKDKDKLCVECHWCERQPNRLAWKCHWSCAEPSLLDGRVWTDIGDVCVEQRTRTHDGYCGPEGKHWKAKGQPEDMLHCVKCKELFPRRKTWPGPGYGDGLLCDGCYITAAKSFEAELAAAVDARACADERCSCDDVEKLLAEKKRLSEGYERAMKANRGLADDIRTINSRLAKACNTIAALNLSLKEAQAENKHLRQSIKRLMDDELRKYNTIAGLRDLIDALKKKIEISERDEEGVEKDEKTYAIPASVLRRLWKASDVAWAILEKYRPAGGF